MTLPSALAAFVTEAPAAPVRVFAGADPAAITYLRFVDQAEQEEAFESAGIIPHEGQILPPDFSWPGIGDISIIGRVVDQPPVYGPPGEDGVPAIAQEATFLDGWYVNVLMPEPPAEPVPGQPLTAAQFQRAIEVHVDAVAAQRGYSSAVSLASYVASTIPLWQAEAQAFVAWRDAVWAYALTELAKVQGGLRVAPETTDAFVAELPLIEWPEAS